MGLHCNDGWSCIADNTCPTGCSFAECIQRAKAVNAAGFSFGDIDSSDPSCKICTSDILLEKSVNIGVYIKNS